LGCRLYWVRRRLGGCSLPVPGDEVRLSRAGVRLLVSLVEGYEFYDAWPGGEGEFLEAMGEAGIRVVRIPTPDGYAPDLDEACRVYPLISRILESGGAVVAHCYGGIGRTGTFLAGYLVWSEGLDPEEAVRELWRHGAGPQSDDQYFFIHFVWRFCRGRGSPPGPLGGG